MKKLLFVVIFSVIGTQAIAVDFGVGPVSGKLYGEFYFSGFYEEQTKDYVNFNKGTDFLDSKSSFQVALEKRSRLGVDLQLGKLTGIFEIGANINYYLRLYYLKYDFGKAGYVLIGQNTTVASYLFGQESIEGNALFGYGSVIDYTLPMLMYGIGGFQISVVHSGRDPFNKQDDTNHPANDNIYYERNMYVPRFEAAYSYSNDSIFVKVYGSYAYNSYKEYDKVDKSKKILSQNSVLVGIGGTYTIVNSHVSFGGYYGLNIYNTGAMTDINISPMAHYLNTGQLEDVTTWGAAIGIGHTFAKMFTPKLGVGYQVSSSKILDKNDEALGAYASVLCQLNQYLALIPEVAYLDDMKDGFGNKQGSRLLAGVIAKVKF